jgi:hypothetical protein
MDITRRTLITSGLGAGLVIALPGTAVADPRTQKRASPQIPSPSASRPATPGPTASCSGPGSRSTRSQKTEGRHAFTGCRRGLGSC